MADLFLARVGDGTTEIARFAISNGTRIARALAPPVYLQAGVPSPALASTGFVVFTAIPQVKFGT